MRAPLLTVEQGLTAWGLVARGEINLTNARIFGTMDLQGATLSNRGGWALNAERLTVDGDAFLRGGFSVDGATNLTGGGISGTLDLSGASLAAAAVAGGSSDAAEANEALRAGSLEVRQGLMCRGLQALGEMHLLDGRITGNMDWEGATLRNAGGYALNAERLVVEGDAFLREFSAEGATNLTSATVTGLLDLSRASLTNDRPQTSPPETGHLVAGIAVVGELLSVNQELICESLTARGTLDLRGAQIGRSVDLSSASLAAPSPMETALDLEEARIGRTLYLRLEESPTGGIDLSNAHVANLIDSLVWPQWLELDGFTYDGLPDGDANFWRTRANWLNLHRLPYAPQIYNQLAGVYRAAGHEDAARRILSARQSERRRHTDDGTLVRGLRDAWSLLLRTTVGYGYFPWRVLYWFAGLLLAGWALFDRLHPSSFSPGSPGPGQPGFHGSLYTLDLLLPVAGLDQRDAWVAHDAAVWWSAGFILVGWLPASVVVAGLAGVFRRD